MTIQILLVDDPLPDVLLIWRSLDGFELLERLRTRSGNRVPAIVLSGSTLFADRTRAKALGAVEFVNEALDYGEFRDCLNAAPGRHGFC